VISAVLTLAGRSHFLVRAGLQKLADPHAAGVTGGAAGRKNVVGADGFVAIRHGSFFADEQ
jgi:hypothetical protein